MRIYSDLKLDVREMCAVSTFVERSGLMMLVRLGVGCCVLTVSTLAGAHDLEDFKNQS